MKKILALIFTVVMLFTFGALTAFATDTEETNVAKVGETEYATLQEAVDAAVLASKDAPQIVTILCDLHLDETIVVSGGSYAIRFDLNGHNIRSSAEVVIENNGFMSVFNSGERASITTEDTGGTVIQNNAMFSMMAANENTVIGDGTGYALKSADFEMYNGLCDLCAGTFDGQIEILSDIGIMSGINGGVYTVDPTPYLVPGYMVLPTENGTFSVEKTVTLANIATFKGYSVNEEDSRIVAGYTLDHDAIAKYEKQNGVSVDFGAVLSIGAIGDKTVEHSLKAYSLTTNYFVFINEISADNYDTELVACMYVKCGDEKKYITADANNNTVFVGAGNVATTTYNKINKGGSL
ncbi:MAG: hypothetical protein J6A96_05175 [Clostridia bacterium]|nr:hypothetical protein [Clostridia bacterium]